MFNYENVKNPRYFKENVLPAHSDHAFFPTEEACRDKDDRFKSSLNGLWHFAYAKNYGSAIAGFENPDYDCRPWDLIKVPAHIQMEGYDKPQYANVQYPWDGHAPIKPGQIPEKFNPTASYVKYFTVPENMSGRRLFISFQGVESGYALWFNGRYVGYSEDTFTPSEFELTSFLVEGENKLAVQVYKWTSGSWIEDQDFFRFSGIFRDVYLFTLPDVHVYDMKIKTLLNDDFTAADLTIDVELFEGGKGTVVAMLLEDGIVVAEDALEMDGSGQLVLKADKPDLWSAESPALYDLTLKIYDGNEQLMEVIPQKVGFRKFELKGAVMHLNGKRIVFKGVNRHEFSVDTGRVMTEEIMRQDIITMKRNNINAIRTCHYPDNSLLYALCDEYGLYMIDETNLESHGTWQIPGFGLDNFADVVPGDNPDWLDVVVDRVNSLYQRDKNHPAVLIWSLGNEAFGGRNIYEMSLRFKALDDTRLVHYEGLFNDRRYPDSSDMESRMYPPASEIEAFLKADRSKPYVCCEYTHAMGNSCGAMHKYTDLTDREPLYQGGFIWDYVDQAIRMKNRYGEEFMAYGGDNDDRPTDYNFCGNGIVYGDRGISPKMQEVKFNYQNITAVVEDGDVIIRNKNLFTSTAAYDCYVTLEKEGVLLERAKLENDVAPLSEVGYLLPITKRTAAGEYVVTVSFTLKSDTSWAKAGHEVAFGQGVYKVEAPEKICSQPIKVVNGTFNIGISGEAFSVLFTRLNGGLSSYVYGGKEMIKSIIKPNFWRAPTDNDMGNLMPGRYAQWKIASLYGSHRPIPQDGAYKDHQKPIENPTLEIKDNSAVVTYTYFLPTTPASSCQAAYTVFGDGTVKAKLTYDPVEGLGGMPEFGMMMKLDADYDHIQWYGNGPAETYWDRQHGAKLGLHRNLVKDNIAGYLVPQECGNKTGVRYAKVTDRKGRGLLFTAHEMNFSALPYTPHELENAMHGYELPQVHYTVIRASLNQMGIAGDDSWGARTHDEYLIDAGKKMAFEFSFKGIL